MSIRCGLVTLLACASIGFNAAPSFAQAAEAARPATIPSYRLSIGDELQVKLFYNAELNEAVKVRPDGLIQLPLIGEMQAYGRTPSELAALLKVEYAKHVRSPEVAVIVREFRPSQVFVDGEVARPGAVVIPGDMTLMQALVSVGGVKSSAKLSEVVIIRTDASRQRQVVRADLRKARDGRNLMADPPLLPGDIIVVPRSKIANVNAWVDQYLRANLPVPLSLGVLATPF